MKRTVAIMAGVATLAMGYYVGSRVWAQQPAAGQPAAPAPVTRIAVVNLNQIIKGYDKTTKLQEEFKGAFKSFEDDIQKMTKDMEKMQADYRNPATTAPQKEALEASLKKLQRDIQDRKEDAQKKLSDKELSMMANLYRDVEAYVQLVAKSRQIELVLHYNDAYNPSDMYSPMNINRKLTTLACMPIYAAPGIDISKEVIDGLNWNNKQRQTSSTAPTPGGHQ